MPVVATPSRRRIVMAVLLALAVAGAVIRATAPDPSTLRDVGTLLLVMWLPAVGNLIAWVIRQLPRRAPQVADFDPAAPFTPHLRAELQPVAVAAGTAVDPGATRCTLIIGRQGFSARLADPVGQVLQAPVAQAVPLQLLRPEHALPKLLPGARFHLLIGTTAVASGQVVAAAG